MKRIDSARVFVATALLALAAACGADLKEDDPTRIQGSPSFSTGPPTPPVIEPSAEPPPSASTKPSVPTTPGNVANFSRARVSSTQVVKLQEPVGMATAPDGRIWIVQQPGQVVEINGNQSREILNIASQLKSGGEQGLLGIAFHPTQAFVYLNFTDTDGHTRIREYRLAGSGVDSNSARDLLKVDQPFANHNGGDLHFGRDGFLYITLGDGGGGNDPHDNGQSLNTLLGKILRIDPRPTSISSHSVSSTNPFVGRSGARAEIWAFGVRNPFRMTFDRANGDMYFGDVGQNSREEIDFQPGASRGGENYGWNRYEGSKRHLGQPLEQHVLPVYEYPTADGNCAVTGGRVYRGSDIPALVGAYLFADFCGGKLRGLVVESNQAKGHRELGPTFDGPAAFGEDSRGEVYVLARNDGWVHRLTAG